MSERPPTQEQERLRQQVVEDDTEDWQRSPGFCGLQRVGGVDLSFIKGDEVNACAQLVVLSYPSLEVMSRKQLYTPSSGGVRELQHSTEEPLKEMEQRIMKKVNLSIFICLFVVLIAALQKGGDSFPLTVASGKVLGKALRSCDKSSKPVYVSVGHKISLDTAVRLTHACCRYRVPEPIRQVPYTQTHPPQGVHGVSFTRQSTVAICPTGKRPPTCSSCRPFTSGGIVGVLHHQRIVVRGISLKEHRKYI
uniref:Endonuclease V n=1 Tax=Fundulus heteroclitus TaxID=8078 RepID=A0A3Q2Q8G7_FUNHE